MAHPWINQRKYKLTSARLRELLHYCPATGIFLWRANHAYPKQWNSRFAGKQAGSLGEGRFSITISLDGKPFVYQASQLVWLYMTGDWPPTEQLDHRDGDPTNNKFKNLRPATPQQNGCNKKAMLNNKLGVKGIHLVPTSGRYRASVQFGDLRKRKYFLTLEDAVTWRNQIAVELHGEFARAA
jgi:hypothetical protein